MFWSWSKARIQLQLLISISMVMSQSTAGVKLFLTHLLVEGPQIIGSLLMLTVGLISHLIIHE